MHIPQGPTGDLTLEPFDQALAAALEPSPDYDVNRWLYVPNRYSEYRYILGTRGRKPLICVGINPSTAAPDALDPTLQSVERIALSNGYDSFLMFNVYAQRATSPDDMEKVCNPLISNPKANSPLPTCVGPSRLRSRISGLCRVTTARRSIPRAAAGCHDKSGQRARRHIAAAVRRERKGRMRFFIAFFGLRHGSPGSNGYASAERNHGPAGFPSYKIIRYFPNSGSGI